MDNFALFTLASLLFILTPGPGNVLSVARGLSQGNAAAIVSSLASGLGIQLHVLLAALGFTTLLLASSIAFTAVKIIGALYLIWLGYQAIRSDSLITFKQTEPVTLTKVFVSGFLTASLSPKISMFMLAFIPQFISDEVQNAALEMALLGSWFSVLTVIVFSIMGCGAHSLSNWLRSKPLIVRRLNVGAGSVLLGAGIGLALTER